jgi:tetratricopeptide (TPR) repeat protein
LPKIFRATILYFLIATLWALVAVSSHAAVELSREATQLYDEGVKFFRARDYAQAASMLKGAEERAPDNFDVQYLLAASLQNAKQYSQAITHFKRAMELHSGTSKCALNIANCYVSMSRFSDALPWFDRYLQDNPDAKDRQAVEVKKENIERIGSLVEGDNLMDAKRYDDAKRFYETALSKNGDSAYLHFKLGAACMMSNDMNRGISEFQWAQSLDPKLTSAFLNIAECHKGLGRIADCIDWYQRFVDEEPDSPHTPKIKAIIGDLKKRVVVNEADPHTSDYLDTCLASGKPCKWMKSKLPLKVFIDNPTSMVGFQSSFRRDCLAAFDEWARASDYRLHFVTVAARELADITIDWTNDGGNVVKKGVGVEQGVTRHSIGQDDEGNPWIMKEDIRILVKHRNGGEPLTDSEMRAVCMHEIGHALGLYGHSTNTEDIMFFSGTPATSGSITDRDRRTIVRLYESYPEGSAPSSSWDSEE